MTTLRALIVDDDPEIIRAAGDILESLGHEYDAAAHQDSARKLLSAGRYDYVLLDLEIPVRDGRLCRIQNGRNLLEEIRRHPNTKDTPVIVMSGHGDDSPDLAVSVLTNGAVHYVKKTRLAEDLDRAIRHALSRSGTSHSAASATAPLLPFNSERRPMAIHRDYITVCGVEVWRDCAQPDLRKALVLLSERRKDGFVRIRGAKLDNELGRDASNSIARRIKDFREAATSAMKKNGLDCGAEDIVATGRGGYHLTEWMDVRAEGEPSAASPGDAPGKAPLNDRQKWVMEQVASGVSISQKDVIAHFRDQVNPSTVKRDLKGLRERDLIATDGNGRYVKGSSTS
jgi:CheY-like chemotaxis protein